jgi:hypothetical protein
MSEKEFPNEYENLKPEDVSKDLESITNISKEHPKTNSSVRTFAKDVAEQMKSDNTSIAKIALAEQGRQREYQTIVKKSKHQQIIYLILTFIFVVGGAILLGLSFNQKNATTPITNLQTQKANSVIFSEQQTLLTVTDFSRAELIETIRQKIDFIKEKGITNILTVVEEGEIARTMYGAEFLSLVAPNLPEEMIEILGQNFMLGFDSDNNYSVFLIVTYSNFDTMVKVMRAWEPFLVQDMTRLLSIQTGNDLELFSKPFNSEIIFNKESRILRDGNQGFVVGYTFMDRNTIVLSTNLATIQEVLKRYSIQEIQ